MALLRAPALLLTLSMLLWAGNILLGRGLHAVFTPTNLNFWRWLLALALLLPFNARGLWRKRAACTRDWRTLLALGVLGVTTFNWLLYQSVRTTTATNVALIYTNVPVFIVAVSWLVLRERIRARQALGIAISMGGVVVIVTRGDPGLLLAWHFTPGDLWALTLVPVWGLYTLLLRRRPPELTPMEMMTAIVLIGVTLLLPAYLWERAAGVRVAWNAQTLGAVGYVGIVASIVAFGLWNVGAERMGANRAGLFTHLYPLFTASLAVLFLGETLHLYHAAGAVLIFGGLGLTTLTPERGATALTAPVPVPPPDAAAAADEGPAAPGGRLWRWLTEPHLVLVVGMLLWSSNWIAGRSLRGEITPLGLNFWRWAFTLAWLLPFTWPTVWRERAAIRRDWKVLVVLGVLGVSVFNLLLYLALARTTATNGVLLNSAIPVVIVGLSWVLLGTRSTWRQATGIGISLGGVLVILMRGDPALLLQVDFNVGDLWALAAVPVWALYSVLLRRRPPGLSPMALLTVLVAIGVAALLPFAVWTHLQQGQVTLSVTVVAALLYVALFPSLLGVACYIHGVGVALIFAGIYLTSSRRAATPG